MPAAPQRNMPEELGSLLGPWTDATRNYTEMQGRYGPALSQANLGSYSASLLGTPTFDSAGWLAQRPDLVEDWKTNTSAQQYYGSLDNYAKADFDVWGKNDPRYQSYNNTGAIGLAREAFRGANPELVKYTSGLQGTLDQLNARGSGGYDAATNGMSLLPSFAGSGASPIQSKLEQQAMNLLDTNGGLTSGELARAQDSARDAYAARGLTRSNRGVGAEILSTDAARRNRLFENANFAAGVDAQSQQQRQFDANLFQNYGQFGANLQQQANQFGANLGRDTANDQWSRAMQYGGLQMSQAIDPSALATGLSGQIPDYYSSLLGYGNDVANTNLNSVASQQNTNANNKAAKQGSVLQGVTSVATLKLMFLCIPEGQRIDTPSGQVAIEHLKPGMRVIGYDGEPVRVQQAHAYLEDESAKRFLRFELEGRRAFSVCDMHRIAGKRAQNYSVGERIGGLRIEGVTTYAGVRRSYDLLTDDRGYQIHGVPVDSMIQEMADFGAQMKG